MPSLEEVLSPDSLAAMEQAKRDARKRAKKLRKTTTAERVGRTHNKPKRSVTPEQLAALIRAKGV